MQIGTSTAAWTTPSIDFSNSGSSTSGMPAFTSSMSAPASTWATASDATMDRSPPRSCSANTLRPVGLIRSPMMQNGRSAPMVTVLDRDRSVVSIRLPFDSRRNAQSCAQLRDAGVLAERDEVNPRHTGLRQGMRGELVGDLEALGLGVIGAFHPLENRGRNIDPRHPR